MATNKQIDARYSLLLPYIKGKTILDLGVGDTTDRFLHSFLASHAELCVGVELDAERAMRLDKQGYTIVEGNAETVELERKFDVVVAGDLIEHVNNPGLLLENVKKHLHPEGLFIFNTPNLYSINFLLLGLVHGGKVKQFEEHVNGYTEDLLKELLRRYNYSIHDFRYFSHPLHTRKSYIIRSFGCISSSWLENMFVVATYNK